MHSIQVSSMSKLIEKTFYCSTWPPAVYQWIKQAIQTYMYLMPKRTMEVPSSFVDQTPPPCRVTQYIQRCAERVSGQRKLGSTELATAHQLKKARSFCWYIDWIEFLVVITCHNIALTVLYQI